LTPYRILQVSGEPTTLFYGNAVAEPIHMGLMRLPDGGGLGLLTLGAPVGRVIQVSVRKPGGIFPLLNLNLNAPPTTCATASSLTALMAAWNTSHTLGLLRQADGTGGTRHTLVYALPAADLADAPRLEFTVTDKATGKLLADGPMGGLTLPSVRQWVAQYNTRLTSGAPSAPAATRLGLFCIALRGLAHADAKRPGFDFLQPDVHFADYAQMSAVFNAALKVPASSPLGRLAQIYAAARTVNQNPLQDPVRLSLKTPKGNVVFAEGYTRMEFDTFFAPASVSAWAEAPGTRDLRLLLVHSKNIALYRLDRTQGPYAFAPILPVAHDTLPPAAGANPNTKPNADALTLPITGPSLRALLRDGLYVRGNPGGIALPEEPFLLDIRVIRDTTLAAVPRAQLQAVAEDFLPSAGSVISGPENSAFQIWPVVNENGTSKYIKDARFGHYMNRGQTRALAYAYEYKLGTGVLFRVDGPDAGKLSAKTPSRPIDEGKKMRLVKMVKSGGAVGTEMDGLLFRAVDYTVNAADESDTTVLRVFERKGSLFGLGMVIPSAGGGGSPDVWPVQVERDAVAPVGLFYGSGVGLPGPLQERGTLEIWLDEDMRLYSSVAEQSESTRLNEAWRFNLEKNSKKKPFYSFHLNEHADYSQFFSPTSGVQALQSMVAGGQGNKSVRFVYRPKGESGRYLEEVVTTVFKPVNCRARIAGDFTNSSDSLEINNLDFKFPGKHILSHWFTDYAPSSLKSRNALGLNNYKVTMDMVPIKVAWAADKKFNVGLRNRTNTRMSIQETSSNLIYNQHYLFDTSLAPKFLAGLNLMDIGKEGSYQFKTTSDTINALVTGNTIGEGPLFAQVENDGLFANTDSLWLSFYDFNKDVAIYSARYIRKKGDADRLAEEEALGSYLWEEGNKLNEPDYNQGTYKVFPLSPIRKFGGWTFANVHDFSPAKPLMIFIHGFNSQEELEATFTAEKSVFKKLRLSGYKGNFAAFHWYGDFNPGGKQHGIISGPTSFVFDKLMFPMDQLNAFKSSTALLSLLSDTLAAFHDKQLIVHSLGNQLVMDMFRQNQYRNGGSVPDIGVTKYHIVEAAVAQSVLYNTSKLGDKRFLHDWRGLFNSLAASYPELKLNHFRRTDDDAIWLWFKSNETLKKIPGFWEKISAASVLLDNTENIFDSDRLIDCPSLFSRPRMRLPKELAVCYTTSPTELNIKTLPTDGIPESMWPGRYEEEFFSIYFKNKWETANAHSFLNLDEAYKTKMAIDRIVYGKN
ncbi:MAG: hypothetical protein M3Y08_19635, partial [Fibrobacterota bacterium]|nr:hypothetical protein [Fibrobacterota bacterium]